MLILISYIKCHFSQNSENTHNRFYPDNDDMFENASLFQNERHCATFYFPKLLIVGLIWIAAIVVSSWQEYNELQDPTYNYRVDAGNFLVSMTNTFPVC